VPLGVDEHCAQAHLDAADRSRIEQLEIFDEFEEWHMIQVWLHKNQVFTASMHPHP